jgi:hypothetical protein
MKNLAKKLLCKLFLHDFYTVEEGTNQLTIACTRCTGRWDVDLQQHSMEPQKGTNG